MRRRFTELKALIKKAITDLGTLNQTKLLCDVFDIYFLEHVLKMTANAEEIKLVDLRRLLRYQNFLERHRVFFESLKSRVPAGHVVRV